jgi:patatin-like phospholipase/acyl hydrolase
VHLTLIILKQLMRTINLNNPLKLYNYFDLISGISTKGCIDSRYINSG